MLPVYKLDFAFSNRKKTCLFTKGHTEEDICMHLFYIIPVEHPLWADYWNSHWNMRSYEKWIIMLRA